MMENMYNLEDVFTTTGVPTVTYVQPREYTSLLVALRTKGKGVVVEGPSGIGKTTAVYRVIDELGVVDQCIKLSARKESDIAQIQQVAKGDFCGIAIIDDFHRLDAQLQKDISDVMKYLADEMDEERKIVVVGINRVGDTLVHFSPDLNNRISTIHFETNSEEKIQELISLGEKALNIKFDDTNDLITHCFGSFHIAQLMCQTSCIQNDIICTCPEQKTLHFSYPSVASRITEEFGRSFFEIARIFATGPRLRREGRAPYLHILKWLSEGETWSISLTTEMQKHPAQKAGVIQVVEKKFLAEFLAKNLGIGDYIHYDDTSKILSVEDPKFMFYLKSLNWNNFAKDIGYVQLVETPKYDYALSFAGSNREVAEKIFLRLQAREIAVFYDKNEQADILARDVEEYLYPIYNSEAAFVVPLLSVDYPNRVWTRIESQAFKKRFGENAVIPIWYSDVPDTLFDESKKYGGMTFDVAGDCDQEVDEIVECLADKIKAYRNE